MRVLLSAYACEPNRGSEPGVGWNMAKSLSGKVELTVVTRANNKEVIETSNEAWIKEVEWLYYDPPSWLTWWKKGGRGVQLFYIIWQIGLYFRLSGNKCNEKYDVIHHMTFGKYWVPSLLSTLGCPFIFGPVGGGEFTPPQLSKEVNSKVLRSESVKRKIIFLMTRNPISKMFYRKITLSFAATEQTKKALKQLGIKNIQMLPQSGISHDEMLSYEKLRKNSGPNKSVDSFVACSAARLIPWKCVDISIRAFIKALPSLPENSLLKVSSTGPELAALKNIVSKAGVEDKILFLGKLPNLSDVYEMMASSNCLLHAATSEAFGQACAESLGLGTPVICWDWAGPSLIVDDSCGKAISVNDENLINKFADAIVLQSLLTTREKSDQSACCIEKINHNFLWDTVSSRILDSYEDIKECR